MEYLKPHKKQAEIIRSNKRFNIVRAGRKGGKTKLEIEKISYKATASVKRLNILKDNFDTGRKVLYIAPTQDQARNIVWEALKRRLDGIAVFNEQRLQAKVKNEDGDSTTIFVGGWENRENYRGLTDVIYIVFDEVDTLKNFYLGWREIFRPMFLDTGGQADFIGTPKKENPNLRRMEKELCEEQEVGASFHFTSEDNPFLPREELIAMKGEYEGDYQTYKQEVLAEYIEDRGALFSFTALIDVFSNTITKTDNKYLIVDVADDGTDKTIFSFWEGLEEYRCEEYQNLNTEAIIDKIREYASEDRIPYSNIAVDAIGVGAGVASSSFLAGVIGYKSSYSPIKTDVDIVRLPNISYIDDNAPKVSDYKNLRSQCIFTLANKVNNHEIASKVEGKHKEQIIEELQLYQDASKGDGKRFATPKEEVKEQLGRSPDRSDTWIMRMYFDVRARVVPYESEEIAKRREEQKERMNINEVRIKNYSNK